VAGLLAGEEAAFDELWRTCYPRVFHFTCSLLKHDRDLAEDVTQEVFVHCFEKIGQFRFESKLTTWMMSIAYRKGLRAMRRVARMTSLNTEQPEGGDAAIDRLAGGGDPRRAAVWRELMERYRWALAALKDHQRSAWVLHREQGLAHDEIAAIIGKTPNSCRILVSRARVRLLALMGGEALDALGGSRSLATAEAEDKKTSGSTNG